MAPPRRAESGLARKLLRDGCTDDHGRVDAAFSQFDLSTRSGYGAFLQAQSACTRPMEDALTAADVISIVPDWPSRRRSAFLTDDLLDLELDRNIAIETPRFAEPSECLGALYVLEGSRFGGAVLSRRVFAGAPLRFLTASAPPEAWRNLIEALDRNLTGDRELAMAIRAARAVFRCFEVAASQTWEGTRV